MVNKIQTLFISLAVATQVTAQSSNFQLVRQLGGSEDDIPRAITLDLSGNLITVGSFFGVADFDPGPLTFTLASTNNPFYAFISKLDAQGNFVWAKQLGNYDCDITSNSVVTNTVGEVYVTGRFFGDIDFDPGPGQNILTGQFDAYVLKLDPSGNFLWVQTKANANGTDISIDTGGNVYFAGDAGPYNEIFACKLDAAGNFLWTYKADGLGSGYPASIACGALGNVFLTGTFDATTDFDPGVGIFTLTPIAGVDAVVLKLSNNGNLLWAKQFAGNADEFGQAIAVDGLENSYITGTFRGKTDFDPGQGQYFVYPFGFSDCYISKLDASGNFVWAKHLGSYSGTSYGEAIALDKFANVFTTSAFFGKLDRYTSGQIIPFTTNVYNDAFIASCDSSGNFLWAKQMGGVEHDNGMSLVVDTFGNIFTAGFFRQTVDFDPDPGTYTVTSFGDRDVFIHKMNSCTPEGTLEISSNKSVVCVDENVTLNATGAITYTWGTGALSNSVSVTAASFYFVYGTDNNGCTSSATLSQSISTCAGIENYKEKLHINAYPNPTSGDFCVIPGFSFDVCSFELIAPEGHVVKKGSLPYTSILKFYLAGDKIDPGIYFLVLNFDNETAVLKIVLDGHL